MKEGIELTEKSLFISVSNVVVIQSIFNHSNVF